MTWLRLALVTAAMVGLAVATTSAPAQDVDADVAKANSYDDAWQNGPDGWVANLRKVRSKFAGTPGFALHLGDSITYANGYGQWARHGAGKTPEDEAICRYVKASLWGDRANDVKSGFYLAAYDHPVGGRSFTAVGGITTAQWLKHHANHQNPSIDEMFTAGFTNPDGVQYRDAEMCLIMLGSNDAHQKRPTQDMIADLTTIIDKIMASNTMVVLSTISPLRGSMEIVQGYNQAIRQLARKKKLPLVDFCAEIIRRRPGNAWDGTLISQDGVHPTAKGADYHAAGNPYADKGKSLSEVGLLLRGWLTIQKFKQIKELVIDPVAASGEASRPVGK
ncbi:MAG TPA: SGNH/GDSL hydrolase family protein [Phycisphaerae bacterium]|nr:SGNH/GDSL hydrolase family protein [Phycisphaerae bacterium]